MIDVEKYFKKSDLLPAIVQEDGTGEVLMLAYMNRESILGFGRVQEKNFGIKAQLQVICKKLCQFSATAMMIPCLLK